MKRYKCLKCNGTGKFNKTDEECFKCMGCGYYTKENRAGIIQKIRYYLDYKTRPAHIVDENERHIEWIERLDFDSEPLTVGDEKRYLMSDPAGKRDAVKCIAYAGDNPQLNTILDHAEYQHYSVSIVFTPY